MAQQPANKPRLSLEHNLVHNNTVRGDNRLQINTNILAKKVINETPKGIQDLTLSTKLPQGMLDHVKQYIGTEDDKNPLTDVQVLAYLGTVDPIYTNLKPSDVAYARSLMDIPASEERKYTK